MKPVTVSTVFFTLILLQLSLEGLSCSVKCNPCMDIICPEVHVETSRPPVCDCTQPCCCNSAPPCCCNRSPYCCNTNPCCCNSGQFMTHSTTPFTPCSPYQYPMYPCHPYPPMPMVQHPPSYCVQSVVVGGKADPVEEKKNKTSSFDPPFDPMAAVGLSGGFQDPQNLDPAQNASEQLNNVDRYEKYIEKLLCVLQDRCDSDPECITPSPMMVVAPQPCTTQLRVKKVRKKTHKKYRLASCEEEYDPVVVVEEEEQEPAYVVAQPSCCCCCRPRCCCRSRSRPCCCRKNGVKKLKNALHYLKHRLLL
ncbi:uncharacterized protein isoform X2 [Rhodnius prolixus]|uniref:uncharacterized protein isoform X2 n=1 Tax=Rhodnius prolixus TaxID=13249 RepID=UPI003D18E132